MGARKKEAPGAGGHVADVDLVEPKGPGEARPEPDAMSADARCGESAESAAAALAAAPPRDGPPMFMFALCVRGLSSSPPRAVAPPIPSGFESLSHKLEPLGGWMFNFGLLKSVDVSSKACESNP